MNTHASHDQSATAAAWPKMDLSLRDERHGAPPPFPLDVLTPFWRAWTEAATASTGALADYVALSLAAAAGDLVPPDAVSAIPASMVDAGPVLAVDSVDLGVTPTLSAISASDFGMATPVSVAQGQVDAAPGVPAIPATGSVAAMDRPGINGLAGDVGDSGDCGRFRKIAEDDARRRKPLESRETRETPELRKLRQHLGVPPSSAPTPEAAPWPSDERCAIPASGSDVDAGTARPAMGTDAGVTRTVAPATATAGEQDPPPQLSARSQRLLHRREKLAHVRNGVEPARQGMAA